MLKLRGSILSLLLAASAFAQNGDNEGEVQQMLFPEHLIPDAPVLSPEEALKSFHLQPGFRIEIVADDSLLNTPVAMEFDPDGRIWVVEMVGYMRDADGTREDEPVGSIAVLEDTDGDGRMDKRTVFLDQLVMPRAICLTEAGVIIAEMPNLWLCKDTDGDLKCDEKTAIFTNYVQGDIKNPEHNANGLMWGLDNWIYSANYTKRIRQVNDRWIEEPTVFRGQWGLSQDDFGRQVYDTNSDQLRIDLIPAEYLLRNPNYRTTSGINVDPVGRKDVFPVRVNPGINRGYQPHMLKDGYLTRFTGACGPVIYRGDNFPKEFHGNAFVPEPTGNLIKRNILTEQDGVVTGEYAYDDSEFLASTDERFRPVNLYNGPDGAMYVVDMYRGLIQHKIYLTTYLRNQVEKRHLDKPVDMGRIYRVVYEGNPVQRAPKMSGMSSTELVNQLASSKGWVRDTAQRLLVEQNDGSAVPALKQLAVGRAPTLASVHALWTLEGMNQMDAATIHRALKSANPKVQVAALRIADTDSDIATKVAANVAALSRNASGELAWQLALSLGNYDSPETDAALSLLAAAHSRNKNIIDATISGLAGRELSFVKTLLETAEPSSEVGPLLRGLASSIFREANAATIDQFFTLVAQISDSSMERAVALLDGAASIMPKAAKEKPAARVKPIMLAGAPGGYDTLLQSSQAKLADKARQLEPLLTWDGKAGGVADEIRPLTDAEKALFDQGKELYMISCGACHQPHGNGQEGLAPPLVGSEWVMGSEERIIRIALHGVMGPISVKDEKWDLIMPGLGIFEDEQIAGILTFIRREWDNTGDPVTPEKVKAVRDQYPDRIDLWTEEELLKIK